MAMFGDDIRLPSGARGQRVRDLVGEQGVAGDSRWLQRVLGSG
jgi:hypothetical protein